MCCLSEKQKKNFKNPLTFFFNASEITSKIGFLKPVARQHEGVKMFFVFFSRILIMIFRFLTLWSLLGAISGENESILP